MSTEGGKGVDGIDGGSFAGHRRERRLEAGTGVTLIGGDGCASGRAPEPILYQLALGDSADSHEDTNDAKDITQAPHDARVKTSVLLSS